MADRPLRLHSAPAASEQAIQSIGSFSVTVSTPQLARRLGLFDATMLVMGGIVGAGIFVTPYVVARQVHSSGLILGAWLTGGVIAMLGAFVYAELAARRPDVGGQYAYLRDAFHPGVAFVYGWVLLLVTQSGGMAAVALTFSRYFLELTLAPLPEWSIAMLTLVALTIVNALGVRAGSTVQNTLMVLKVGAIAILVGAGLFGPKAAAVVVTQSSTPLDFGTALVPILFAYGGWQTASFVAAEMKNPQRDLPRGLLLGVGGVILLYLSVTFVCLRVLGPDGLANATAPATSVMRAVFGEAGARVIAVGITISTLGFLSQGMLTAPRVYYAMAQDGVFFRSVGRLNPRTAAPVVAIALQGLAATIIALSGKYEQILNYVVSVDFISFGLTGVTLFVFRARDGDTSSYRAPGHPITTAAFTLACWGVVGATIYQYPQNSVIGLGILLSGIPIYSLWKRKR
ncbi:MAG: amino acid permease [Bryobacteraceae bacterium]